MPIVLNDAGGVAPFGSAQIVIGSETYYVEDFSATTATNTVDRPDEVGSPRDQIVVSGKTTGTMTLQLETTGSAIPTAGDDFLIPAQWGNDAAYSGSITEVTTPRSVGAYATCNVGWVKLLNS